MRELSEEILGNPEHDGNASGPIDYDAQEPFASINKARGDGQIRVWYLAAEPLAPAAQACVELAWHHQDLLLGQHR